MSAARGLCAAGVGAVLLLIAGLAVRGADGSPFRFVDATPGSGIDYRNVCGAPAADKGWLNESMGAGAAWLDYDGDGKLDLYVVNGSAFDRAAGRGEPNRLWRGDGKGGFKDVTEAAGVGHRGWGYGVAVGDYDNDGDPDIFVTNLGPNVLYRNNGDGTFTDVTAEANVGGGDRWSSSAAFFDMDGDGDLDLYVGNYMITDPQSVPRRGSDAARGRNCAFRGIQVYCGPLGEVPHHDALYRNDGNGRFSDVSRSAGIEAVEARYALGVVTGDFDLDGDQDIYVANDSVSNTLWENAGNGTFRDVGLVKLAALNVDGRAQAGMGVDMGDYDGDGWPDLVTTNFSQDLNTLYRNAQGKFFIDDSQLAGMSVTYLALSWGVAFRDFDLDGDLDLFIANGHVYPEVDGRDVGTRFRQTNHLFANDGGRMREVGAASGPGMAIARSFRGAAFADFDDDGDIDVFLTALDDSGLLLRNESPRSGRHWLQVRLVGTKSNRDGVGARVTVKTGDRVQVRERTGGGSYLSASDPRLQFGLGAAARADLVEVRWPSGAVDRLSDVAADRVVTVREGQTAP